MDPNNEKAFLKEIEDMTHWCQDNNLVLNFSKTEEMIVYFGKKQRRNNGPVAMMEVSGVHKGFLPFFSGALRGSQEASSRHQGFLVGLVEVTCH